MLQEHGAQIAHEWVELLVTERHPLARQDPAALRIQSASWVALLLEGMREGSLGLLQPNVSLGVKRLLSEGMSPAQIAQAYLGLRQILLRHALAEPALGEPGEVALAITGQFDQVLLAMLESVHRAPAAGEGAPTPELVVWAQRQSMITRLARAICAEPDTMVVAKRLLEAGATVAGTVRGAVALAQEPGGRPEYLQAQGLDLGQLCEWTGAQGDPLSHLACSKGKPVLLRAPQSHSQRTIRGFAAQFGLQQALAIPIMVTGRCLGTLQLFDPVPGARWDGQTVALLGDLSAQAGLALQNLLLVQATAERNRELTELHRAAKRFAELTELQPLLEGALESAHSLSGAACSLLWLPGDGDWQPALSLGEGCRERASLPAALAEEVLERQQPFIAPADLLARLPLAGLQVRNGLLIPVPSRERPAIIGLINQPRPAGFTAHHVDVLSALQYQLTLSLRNAELLQSSRQLVDRLRQAIDSLGSALTAVLDVDDMLSVVCGLVLDLTQGTGALAYLRQDQGELEATAGLLAGEEGAFVPPRELLAGLANQALSGQQLVQTDLGQAAISAADRAWLEEHGARSVLVVPMLLKGEVIGAVLVLLPSVEPLSEADRLLLVTFIQQAAVGVDNVRLFAGLQRRLVELADFTWVSAKMTATLEQPVILEITVGGVQRALNPAVVFVALLDSQQQLYLPPQGHYGLEGEVAASVRVAVGQSPLASRVLAGNPVSVTDLAASEFAQDPLLRAAPNLHSLAAVPMGGGGRTGMLGVLCGGDFEAHSYQPHEEALLSAYANQAALALQNASNYEAVMRHVQELETVLEVTKALASSLELDRVLHHLLEVTTALLGAPVASIMLVKDSELTTEAAIGLPREHPLFARTRIGESIPGLVAQTMLPLSSGQLPRDGRFKAREAARAQRLQSMLSVPLVARGETRGVLNIFTHEQREFSEAELRLLTTVGNEAAVAIENAELYRQARDQAARMRALMEEVNHRIKNNLQSILGIVQLQLTSADPELEEALREIISRIQAIAFVHEMLVDEDVGAVDVREIARRILANARQAMARPELHIAGQVSGARVKLPSRKATALASIVNELVYNALKHGFPGRTQGTIAISMQEAGGQVLVQVKDDGVGLPPGFDLERDSELGLRIVQGLVRQDLEGEFSLTSNGGTVARVRFNK